MTIDSRLVLLVLQFRVVVKCISINQYRYRYRDIDIHRLRHYMIIDGVQLFSLSPHDNHIYAYHHHKSAALAPYLSRVGSNTCPGQVLEIDILRRTETEGQAQCTANRTGSPYNISLKSQAYQISFQPKRINKSWNHTIS